MLNNSNSQRKPSSTEIEQLQKLIRVYKKYYNSKDMTMLEAMVAKSEEEFKKAYPEISMERSDEINPLTGCAHGTKASTILAAIMFTKGQLLPKMV